jgi:biopolymer transport protein TolR
MARRKRRSMAQINVVPYIDVMLVLLVIFMVATPMMQPGIIDLPSVARANHELNAKPLRVQIAHDESLKLTDGGETMPEPDTASLIAAIKSRSLQEARPVVIEGDKEVRYDAVVQVMEKLKGAGVEHVGLVVMPKT